MNWPEWTSPDGRIRLINADCLEVLPFVEADAVVTDPPYGIGEAAGKNKSRSMLADSRDYGNLEWDNHPASQQQLDAIRCAAKWQIIFGGNYFHLPPSSCWLVWDKLNGENDFADCELAWTNLRGAVRRLAFRWHGMIRDEPCKRVHPTQKPVNVMIWAMSHLPDCELILDPFAGSCTTAVACIRSHRSCICIEREPSYFQSGIQRVKDEYARTALFNDQEELAQC